MKLPKMLRPSRSIAAKLTWRIIGGMLFVLTIILALIFTIMWLLGVVLLSGLYMTASNASIEKVNNVFTAVEIAVANNQPEARESLEKTDNPYFAVNHLLELNDDIVGAAVAVNPNCKAQRGRISVPYAYRDSTGIKNKQLDTKTYDFRKQEWFIEPIKQKKSWWSEPYQDKGGGEGPMVTYSLPLTNSQGEVYAVQTADIALDWIGELTEQLDSINNEDFNLNFFQDKGHSYSFIVTRKGTFVAHKDKSRVLNESIYDFFKNSKDFWDVDLAEKIMSGEQQVSPFMDSNGEKCIIFCSPIEHTGWTMGIVLPVDDLFQPAWLFVKVFIVITLIGVLILICICHFSIHHVTKPLRQFANSADEIAKGNFKVRLPYIKTKDEMKRLHDSFETMQQSLVRQIEETKTVNEEKGRMESELLIARNIQMSMLPKTFPPFPERNDIDIYGELTPAKEVGGDLFDFFIRDEKLFFCIGDVSGKGVPASLVMAVTRSLFRSTASHEAQPSRIMSTINDSMADGNDSDMFVTLFIGVLDLPTGRLRYCNAGHNAPLIIAPERNIYELPVDSNLPAAIMAGWKFTTQETVMEPQTTIFLFTDGLTEAEDKDHHQFQDERVQEVVSHAPNEPKALTDQVGEAVHRFVGDAEQSDDLTMLAIQYKGQQEQDACPQHHLRLPNDIDEVPKLAEFVDEVCEAAGVEMSVAMSLNLAMEEAVVNVMSYAYPPDTKGDIDIDACANASQLKFTISDWGIPFDPTGKDDVDTTLNAEERPIGGLGIHLVRQIMDSLNYERIDGKNVLTLCKKLV